MDKNFDKDKVFKTMKPIFSADFVLGILGGGQLGKMLLEATNRLGIQTHVLDPDADAVCRNMCTEFVQGNFDDYDTVYDFGKNTDVLTIEIEHINTEALIDLEKIGVIVQPSPHIIAMIQNKGHQKVFYTNNNLPTAAYNYYDENDHETLQKYPMPYVWKACTGGYDGKGVKIIRTTDDLKNLPKTPCIAEALIDYTHEIAVIVARNANNDIKVFAPVAMEFCAVANLVDYVIYPANIPEATAQKAEALAKKIAEKLNICGVLAVEMFVLKNGELLINEIAPRPHNSGHLTIEANHTSQYDQHLRAILNLPLGSTQPKCAAAVMVNIVGATDHTGLATYKNIHETLKTQGANLHIYGKKTTKPHRKMAHATIIGNDTTECMDKAVAIKKSLMVLSV